MGRLEGKVALVTGGSRGIGAAIAKRLALDGARVVLTYNAGTEKAEAVAAGIIAGGGEALAIRADVADDAALGAAVTQTVARFGALDIVVNNAGIALMGPLDAALSDFDRTMAVNVRGVFVLAQEAARVLRDDGRIITIGSVNADRVPFQGATAYATSKAALVGMTKGLARDLAPRRITVNVIQPGPVDTDMNPANGPFAALLTGLMTLPRYGTADEIAGLTAYLASPEAGYVTGAAINIDGGFM